MTIHTNIADALTEEFQFGMKRGKKPTPLLTQTAKEEISSPTATPNTLAYWAGYLSILKHNSTEQANK